MRKVVVRKVLPYEIRSDLRKAAVSGSPARALMDAESDPVRDVIDAAWLRYARPVSVAALEKLERASKTHGLVDAFQLSNEGFARLEEVQGGPRVFTNETWDKAVDQYFGDRNRLTGNKEETARFFAEGGNIFYWTPSIAEDSYFDSPETLWKEANQIVWEHMRNSALYTEVSAGSNVIDWPYRTTNGVSTVLSVIWLSIDRHRSGGVDSIRISIRPLLDEKLGFFKFQAVKAQASLAKDRGGNELRDRVVLIGSYMGQYTSKGPCWMDAGMDYFVPLTDENARQFKGWLAGALQSALQEAGYRHSEKAESGVGPRAYRTGYDHTVFNIRQPGRNQDTDPGTWFGGRLLIPGRPRPQRQAMKTPAPPKPAASRPKSVSAGWTSEKLGELRKKSPAILEVIGVDDFMNVNDMQADPTGLPARGATAILISVGEVKKIRAHHLERIKDEAGKDWPATKKWLLRVRPDLQGALEEE